MNVSKIKLTPNLLILFTLFGILILIRVISEFNGLYGQDAYEYLRYSRRLTEFLTGGNPPGDYFWPVNFPLLGAILSLVIQDNIFALQLISMLSFIFTVFYTFRLIRLIYPNAGKEALFYLFLFLVLSPFLFQSAFLVMSDMLAVFLTTAAIYHVLKYRGTYNRTDLYLTIFFASSAIMTRYAAAAVLVYPGIMLANSFYRKARFYDLFFGLLILVLSFIPHILIKGSNAGEFLWHTWLDSWSIKNWFLSEFSTNDGYHKYRFPNIVYSLSNSYYPGFFFPCVLLILFIRKTIFKNMTYRRMLLIIAIYALFLAGFPTQNMRFLLLTFPLILAIMFPPFQNFRDKILRRKNLLWSFAALAVLIQTALIYKYSLGIYQANQVEKKIARTILPYSNRPIYTFAIDGALRCYGVDSDDIVNMWYSELDSVEISALVLFNEQKFTRQWYNKNPMINWQMIRNNYDLEKVESLPTGWELFKIKGRKN